ncbi:hypothetical protein [Nocardia altamirensis]|uniref:hypothetical protein n=1 Tax=Nocardia TaxID=1817 RepID=UPI000B26A0E0|nr:hypothetical protein [Nocardia altamirensis]
MAERIEETESGSDDKTTGTAPEPGGSTESTSRKADAEPKAARPGTVSIRVSTVIQAVAIGVLAVAVCVLAGFLWSARSDIADRNARAEDDRKAEQISTDYAVGAATLNYQDINGWVGRLRSNTTPQLANKYDAVGSKLEQILVPLKWTSTATPISAKVVSAQGNVYKVNVFVNVSSTTAQNPEGTQTVATYNVTMDKSADWKITDVGGIDGALPLK